MDIRTLGLTSEDKRTLGRPDRLRNGLKDCQIFFAKGQASGERLGPREGGVGLGREGGGTLVLDSSLIITSL